MDHRPRILVVDNGTMYLQHLLDILTEYDVTVRKWSNSTKRWDQYDLVVLSATSYIPTIAIEKITRRELRFVRRTRTPIIGICFGFHVIAKAFGAHTKFLFYPHIGTSSTAVANQSHPIFMERRYFDAMYNHWFASVDPGPHLKTLATYERGIAVAEHRERPIIGLQFHPETKTGDPFTDNVFYRCVSYLLHKHESLSTPQKTSA